MHRAKERMILSFTVFAMFFGAGNLIFPVFLAYESGPSLIPAFAGFALTAIGLPVLSLIAIGRSGSLTELASRVHPIFSVIFTIAIYLTIGPCLAIPRTASTSFEMVVAAAGIPRGIPGIIYSALFFTAGALVALRPEKLSKRLGRILSPLLILLIVILFAGVAAEPAAAGNAVSERYAGHPFSVGFQEGYQTMDAIAGLVFGLLLSVNLTEMKVSDDRKLKEGAIASLFGGMLLLLIYSALAFIGVRGHSFISSPQTGADILSAAAAEISPSYGRILIALIFIIACFNTSVSLLSSCGEYFSRLVPSISRGKWIALFAVISGIIANAGLEKIISLSSPILSLIYPGAIMLIILGLIPGSGRMICTYRLGVSAALISSLLTTAGVSLPFSSSGFGWIIPSLIFSLAGLAADMLKLKHR